MSDDLTARALRIDDAPAINGLLDAMERAEPVDEGYDEEEVVEELTSPAADLRRGSIGVLDGDRLVAFGLLYVSDPGSHFKASIWGGVHPDRTHRGIGTQVLRRLASGARTSATRTPRACPAS